MIKLLKGACQYRYSFTALEPSPNGFSSVKGKVVPSYKLYLYTYSYEKKELDVHKVKLSETETLVVTQYEDGVISYGVDDSIDKPKHGSLWSGNSSTFYEGTGELVIEDITILTESGLHLVNMLVADVLTLLPEGYTVIRSTDGACGIISEDYIPDAIEAGYAPIRHEYVIGNANCISVKRVAQFRVDEGIEAGTLSGFKNWYTAHEQLLRGSEYSVYNSRLHKSMVEAMYNSEYIPASTTEHTMLVAAADIDNNIIYYKELCKNNAILLYNNKIVNHHSCVNVPSINALVKGIGGIFWESRCCLGFKTRSGSVIKPFVTMYANNCDIDSHLEDRLLSE